MASDEGAGVDVEETDGPAWPTGARPEVPEPRGGAAVGCLKAVGLLVALALVGGGLIVWVVARTLDPVTDGAGRLTRRYAEGFSVDGGAGPGPGGGARSERLGVLVAPATGLADGATVTVSSDAFGEAEIVGVTTCLRKVLDDDQAFAAACDLNEFATFAVPAGGPVSVPYRVRRVATVGSDAVDCGAAPGRCVLALADMDDYDRSGFLPLAYAADDPAPDLVPSGSPRPHGGLRASATPTGAVPDGAALTVVASGFVPGEPLQVSVCDDTFPTASPTEACAALHDINWYLGARYTDESTAADLGSIALRADAQGRATASVPAVASFRPFGSGLGDTPDPTALLVDCRKRAGRCSVVVAAAADPARSAVVPYELATG